MAGQQQQQQELGGVLQRHRVRPTPHPPHSQGWVGFQMTWVQRNTP